jgi:hypothetical protein
MGWKRNLAAGIALCMVGGTAEAAQDLCTQAVAIAPGKICVANPHGVALATERSEAERIAAAVRDGEQRFIRHFGRPPSRYAIIQDGRPEDYRALRAAGFIPTLPWLTPAQFEAASLESVRRGTEAQLRARGMTAEQVAPLIQQAEANWRARNSLETRLARDAGVLPHEVGHGWYVQLFWPGTVLDNAGHYGGPGPDWLDETAAILMETDAFAADRRRQFEQVYRGTAVNPAMSGIPAADLIDLPRFLSREHPGRSLQEGRSRPAPGQGPGIRVLTGEEARSAARGAALFYLQSRMFADFLIERTGNPAIFAEIGAAFGAGRMIDQWLAASGRAHRLGTTVAELDGIWRSWLQARFGPPRAAPAS